MHSKMALMPGTGIVAALSLVVAASAGAAIHEVTLQGITFTPSEITVQPGDTVRWVWVSGSHTVTSGSNCVYDGMYFDQPVNSSNPVFEWVVPEISGDLPYFCRPHCAFGMTGTMHITGDLLDFVITLDGDQAVPPADTPAFGSGTATLDPLSGTFSWDFSFSGLLGNETAAHFHGAAPQCETAGVQIALPLGSPKMGSQVITQQQMDDLTAGLWYVNVHSTMFPAGEIRGQVMPAPLVDPLPDLIMPGNITVMLEPVATGLTAPNWGTVAPGDSANRLFVTDQAGILWAVDLDNNTKSVFLDTTSLLVTLGIFGPDSFDERGLLGVAFHPDYQNNGLLYTYTSQPVSGAADFSTIPAGETANHQAVITEWHVNNPADPASVVDPASARELFRVDEPQFNHNAGALNFGPDGMLYISFGDGGGADDKDGQDFLGNIMFGHGCAGNGQDLSNPLGSLLRIDPLGNNSANGNYGIPADNPFVGTGNVQEIYAYGLRNPFRFSFDSFTGDLLLADVGQNDIEEINIVASGGNYGWNNKEGTFYFVANGNQDGYVTDVPLSIPAGISDPIAQYDHSEGVAIVGGFVYRGSRLPMMEGRYIFGDFARTFSNDGRLFYLDESDNIHEFNLHNQAELGMSLLGFGQDANGEVYVMANAEGVPFGTSGVVFRIRLRPGDLDGDGDVDQADLGALLAAYLQNAGGDIDGDGDTDQADLGILLANFGT